MEATPWSWHTYSKKTPHKRNFSHYPGECPAGCVTEPLRSFYRWGPPLLLETASGSRPPPPGPASLQSTQSRASHAAAGRDLAAITEPGHLWPGEAGDARRSDDSSFSVGHALMLLALLKAPHVCRERRCRGQGSIQSQGLLSRERMMSRRQVGAPHIPSSVSNLCPRRAADTPG